MLRLRMGGAVPPLLCPVEGQVDYAPKQGLSQQSLFKEDLIICPDITVPTTNVM
jgi:hypothetical protein